MLPSLFHVYTATTFIQSCCLKVSQCAFYTHGLTTASTVALSLGHLLPKNPLHMAVLDTLNSLIFPYLPFTVLPILIALLFPCTLPPKPSGRHCTGYHIHSAIAYLLHNPFHRLYYHPRSTHLQLLNVQSLSTHILRRLPCRTRLTRRCLSDLAYTPRLAAWPPPSYLPRAYFPNGRASSR